MTFVPPQGTSVPGFLLILLFVVTAFVYGVFAANRRLGYPAGKRTVLAACGAIAWVAFMSALVASGFVEAKPMPRILMFFGMANLGAVILALSPVGKWLALGIPLWALVGFQAFRLPLELILHSWAQQGSIPTTMTWSGANWDILSGILALIAATVVYKAHKSKAAAWAANIVGFILLINVMRVATLSSPLPFAWSVEPPLQLANYLPYALIGPVCVAGALAGHLILTRALLLRKSP